ncbi:hypothetical protein AVEN_85096-1 [Araneus ventricosus]|uniref:Uncharacterized protein n=1 Tax=Araneus ventricosus TaxID=182803 RepID=A0A4Y2SG47_ARAVE|nr:hypothetical protein AVEN_85096-1 [Araneus ventricosus]
MNVIYMLHLKWSINLTWMLQAGYRPTGLELWFHVNNGTQPNSQPNLGSRIDPFHCMKPLTATDLDDLVVLIRGQMGIEMTPQLAPLSKLPHHTQWEDILTPTYVRIEPTVQIHGGCPVEWGRNLLSGPIAETLTTRPLQPRRRHTIVVYELCLYEEFLRHRLHKMNKRETISGGIIVIQIYDPKS